VPVLIVADFSFGLNIENNIFGDINSTKSVDHENKFRISCQALKIS
jgi:hypothetical protein